MKNEFIPYTQGMELKWLGFNEQCLAVYFNGTFFGSPSIFNKNESRKGYLYDCTAPLYQQAFKWFREKYGLIGQPIPLSKSYPGRVTHYGWSIVSNQNSDDYKNDNEGFDTYEEAELECLKKLIEIIKKK